MIEAQPKIESICNSGKRGATSAGGLKVAGGLKWAGLPRGGARVRRAELSSRAVTSPMFSTGPEAGQPPVCRILCRVLADLASRGQNPLVARLPVGVYEHLHTSRSAGCAGVFVSGDCSGVHLTCGK